MERFVAIICGKNVCLSDKRLSANIYRVTSIDGKEIGALIKENTTHYQKRSAKYAGAIFTGLPLSRQYEIP